MTPLDLLRAPRDEVLGINRRNLELILRLNPRAHFPLADDKLRAKQVLAEAGIPVAPTLTTFSSFHELRLLDERLAGLEAFVVKPARGRAGRGILVVVGREQGGFRSAGGRLLGRDELRRHLADVVFGVYSFDRADTAVIEPRLLPHPFFAELYPGGLSDLRLITAERQLVLCMARVPTRSSDGRANLHQGALGLSVDLDSGEVRRAWHRGHVVERHPDSGQTLLGGVVPHWQRIREIGLATADAVPLGFLGIDVVVDRQLGPLVLEINVRPGLEIQNVTGVPLRRRLEQLGVLEEAR